MTTKIEKGFLAFYCWQFVIITAGESSCCTSSPGMCCGIIQLFPNYLISIHKHAHDIIIKVHGLISQFFVQMMHHYPRNLGFKFQLSQTIWMHEEIMCIAIANTSL